MTLKVDYSPDTGALVTCTECPYWHAFRFSRYDAWMSARDHEVRSHPSSTQATVALNYWRRKGSQSVSAGT